MNVSGSQSSQSSQPSLSTPSTIITFPLGGVDRTATPSRIDQRSRSSENSVLGAVERDSQDIESGVRMTLNVSSNACSILTAASINQNSRLADSSNATINSPNNLESCKETLKSFIDLIGIDEASGGAKSLQEAVVKISNALKDDPGRPGLNHSELRQWVLSALSAFAVSVGVVSFWRGVWLLSDNLLFTDNPIKSAGTSLGIGMGILLAARSFNLALAPPIVNFVPFVSSGHNNHG